MRFMLAILAFLTIGAVLSYGLLLAAKGQPLLLVVGFLAYGLAFTWFGCLSTDSH